MGIFIVFALYFSEFYYMNHNLACACQWFWPQVIMFRISFSVKIVHLPEYPGIKISKLCLLSDFCQDKYYSFSPTSYSFHFHYIHSFAGPLSSFNLLEPVMSGPSCTANIFFDLEATLVI